MAKATGKKMSKEENEAARKRADKKKADRLKVGKVDAQNMPAATKKDIVEVYALVNMHCQDGCVLVKGKMCDLTKKEKSRLEEDKRGPFFRDKK